MRADWGQFEVPRKAFGKFANNNKTLKTGTWCFGLINRVMTIPTIDITITCMRHVREMREKMTRNVRRNEREEDE